MVEDELDAAGLVLAPGIPGCELLGLGTPSGGAAFAGWAASQDWNAERESTCTVERMKACPGPHSSVHSTG